jgi:hypothetical protein
MTDQQLLQKIKELYEREEDPLPERVLKAETFLLDPRNKEISDLFETSSYKKYEWNWQQIIRFALKKANSQQYMYDKLWNLLLKHRGHYNDYFELETEEGTYPLPNPLSDLNRFESLYNEFFQIYNSIINQIHFEFPKKEYFGPNFRGKINWQKTLQKSNTPHPMNFTSDIPIRKFVTPGNVLLVLCVLWMHKEASRILQLNFVEPLSKKDKFILQLIFEKTKNLLNRFPFQDVVKESTKYWNFVNDAKPILALEYQLKKEINEKKVRNQNYSRILFWIEKFRNLNLMMVTEKTPVRNLVKSQRSQDTVYEAWMFFEFFDYFYEKGLYPKLKIDTKPYSFEFEYNDQKVIFWYDRQYNSPGPYAWVTQQRPDFTIMVNEKIIGVFDAKNFSQGENTSPARVKMLSYMSNFNCDFGVLFFPFVPEFWDEWNKKQRRQSLFPYYTKLHPEKSQKEIESMNIPDTRKALDELETKVQNFLEINSVKQIPNPQRPEMKFLMMRLEPNTTNVAIQMKKQTIETLFEEIIKRIPILAK